MFARSRSLRVMVPVALVFAATPALGVVIEYTAALSGPNESPVNASPGTGFATVDVDSIANTMRVQISFTGLLGTTSASHIHSPTLLPGAGTAGVATTTPSFAGFPLGVTAGTYDSGLLDMTAASSYNPAFVTANGGTTATAFTALQAGMASGEAYLNIHTSVVPGGEIRGFLQVPEPATATTLAAIGSIALRRRRRI